MNDIKPWYKQFWPWVLIGLPATAVIASVTTLFIAIENKPDMVVEDYYKKGKAIDVDLTRLDNAYKLALKFKMNVQDTQITLSQTYGEPQTAALRLRFIHRTQQAKDFEQLITANGQGIYTMPLTAPIAGKWTIQVESFDGLWRVQTVDTFPSEIDTLFDSFDR